MAEYLAESTQTVEAGSNVLFPTTVESGCCYIRHRAGSGIFTLKGGHKYSLYFGCNLSGGTAGAAVSLAVAISGEEVAGTEMIVTPSASGDAYNVSKMTTIIVPSCCCYTISIINPGTATDIVANANLIIKKED